MTATEELRRLLDERGVEWKAPASYDGSTKYDTIVDGYWFHEYDGRITVHGLTPEQAIAATLGAGTCHLEINTSMTAVVCDKCNYPMPSGTVLTEVHFCPNCGRKVVDE